MPSALTFPGVYIEQLPSGVRAITGVSTSVTAFVGPAKSGPLNKATRIQSFADFERRFGGLDNKSEMSYAVRQFFMNGGADGYVVRIAKNPLTATCTLEDSAGNDVLLLTAIDQGSAPNAITIAVDHKTSSPGSTFNLVLTRPAGDNPSGGVIEVHQNLSMNKDDSRFAATIITSDSKLVRAERVEPVPGGVANARGVSVSGQLGGVADVSTLIDAKHNTINVSLDGAPPKVVVFDTPANSNAALSNELQQKLEAAFTAAAIEVKVDTEGGTGRRVVITSRLKGEKSSVRVTPGNVNDAARSLMLGTLSGGLETEAAAVMRPVSTPNHARLTGDVIGTATDLNGIPSTRSTLKITLDGTQSTITLVGPNVAGTLVERLGDIATRLQARVREARSANPAYAEFTASVGADGKHLVLESGTRGVSSRISVGTADSDTLADILKLTAASGADTSAAIGADTTLSGGHEEDLDMAQAANAFIGSRANREGIYALEGEDFNLLVLAGVDDAGIISASASYCAERRAFLIVDAPAKAVTPEEMETAITGTDLPKTIDAAVYYPWIKISDPLTNRLRTVPPSGTIAGVFARTDSTRGVWKAPAGTDAVLVGVQGVAYQMTDGENGTLNPHGANCIRNFPVYGPVCWGARTLMGDDQMASEWKYVPVRRLALYLQESLYRGTKWVVFEPNDEPLWSQIRLNIGAFMHTLFRQGAFQGATPREAYFVRCDRETTTQTDINLGIVNIVVGFAPLKPAEFVVIKFQQIAGQIQT